MKFKILITRKKVQNRIIFLVKNSSYKIKSLISNAGDWSTDDKHGLNVLLDGCIYFLLMGFLYVPGVPYMWYCKSYSKNVGECYQMWWHWQNLALPCCFCVSNVSAPVAKIFLCRSTKTLFLAALFFLCLQWENDMKICYVFTVDIKLGC